MHEFSLSSAAGVRTRRLCIATTCARVSLKYFGSLLGLFSWQLMRSFMRQLFLSSRCFIIPKGCQGRQGSPGIDMSITGWSLMGSSYRIFSIICGLLMSLDTIWLQEQRETSDPRPRHRIHSLLTRLLADLWLGYY